MKAKLLILFIVFAITFMAVDQYDNYLFRQKVERINNRIKELKKQGCSEEEAKQKASIENGMKPKGKDYNFLIKK